MQKLATQDLSLQGNRRLMSVTMFLGQKTLNTFFQGTDSINTLGVDDTARRSRREFLIYFCLDSKLDAINYTAKWIQAVLPEFDAVWLADMYRQRLNDILKTEFGFNPECEYIHSVNFPLPHCDDAVLEIRERITNAADLILR